MHIGQKWCELILIFKIQDDNARIYSKHVDIETLFESNLLKQLFGKLSSSALFSQRIQNLEENTVKIQNF